MEAALASGPARVEVRVDEPREDHVPPRLERKDAREGKAFSGNVPGHVDDAPAHREEVHPSHGLWGEDLPTPDKEGLVLFR